MALLICVRRRPALAVAAVALAATAIFVGSLVVVQPGQHLIFASRLPVVTPAVLAGVLGAAVFLATAFRCNADRPLAWLALGCLLMPAALSNQQLITGIMVSARDWERYANYPILIVGFALAIRIADFAWLRRAAVSALPASALIAVVLVVANLRSYGYWYQHNLQSLALQGVLTAVDASGGDTRILLDEPGEVPLLAARLNGKGNFVLDYTPLFRRHVPDMPPAATLPDSPHVPALYEFWWRTGTAPDQAEATLRAEAAARSGYYLGFLFSFRDHWHPATDNRLVRQADIERLIPSVIDNYRTFLGQATSRPAGGVIRLSLTPPDRLRSAPELTDEPLGQWSVAGVTAYAYRQERHR
jgi:hypothetical protein